MSFPLGINSSGDWITMKDLVDELVASVNELHPGEDIEWPESIDPTRLERYRRARRAVMMVLDGNSGEES